MTKEKGTPCTKCPLRPLAVFRAFTADELAFISTLKSGEVACEPGKTILTEGTPSDNLYTILNGWAFRYKTLSDGRRQILNFALPGSLLGLQSAVLKEMDHSVEALTPLRLCVFPRSKMWSLYQGHAGLAFDLTWLACREERFLDEQLLSVGRRSATERIAYLLVHLVHRAAGLSLLQRGGGLPLPITQQHIADCLGLSLVHTNKTIRRLAARELISWQGGILKLLDEPRLRELSGYGGRDSAARPLI